MDILLWIVAILAIITVVGHGIWVTLRTIAGWFSQPFDRADVRPIAAVMCPRCGEAWGSRLGIRRCGVCGWPSAHAPSSLLGESTEALANLRTRVERYARLGLLSVAVRDRLLQALRDGASPVAIGEAERVVIAPTAPRRPPAITPPAKPTAREIPHPDVPEPVRDAPEPVRPLEEIAARARSYRAAREDEAARAPAADPTPTAPPSPGLRTLLGAFLEERNIRWGEIVGGLLIVGCSLALVISFWASIAERPFLKYGLLNGLTALLFAIGISAERRWKLPSTGQGLLVIATLLTPLNFLAVAALGRGEVVESAWGIAAELGAAALFAWLTYRAGRSLVSRAPGALCVGVLIPSIAMLLIRRWLAPGGGSPTLLALGAIPLSAQTVAVGALMFRLRRRPEDQERDAQELLRLLGVATFATSLALGLILARGGPIPSTLHRLTPLAPLAAVPALAAGLWLWRRTTEPRLVSFRTTGAAIAAAGTLLMLAGLALAWPSPAGMIPVALINFALLTVVALVLEIPAAHALAGACLALAYLVGWTVLAGGLTWQGATSAQAAGALLTSRSGAALVPLVLIFGGTAAAGTRIGRRPDAQAYALIAALAALFSLALVTWHDFGHPGAPIGAAWVYLAYGLTAITAAEWFGRYPLVASAGGTSDARVLAWIGSGLGLAALAQGLVFEGRIAHQHLPWIAAPLAHAALAVGVSSLFSGSRWRRLAGATVLPDVLNRSAVASSCFVAVGLVVAVPVAASSVLAAYLLGLAVVWLALGWRLASPLLFAGFQAVLAGSSVFAVASILEGRPWYAASPHRWLDPRTCTVQALALGAMALGWIGVRLAVRARIGPGSAPDSPAITARTLLDPPWPTFDRALRVTIVLALVALAGYGAFPGVASELTPRALAAQLQGVPGPTAGRIVPPFAAFEVAGIPHAHALGVGSWALLGLALTVLLAGHWERFRRLDLIGALLVASMASPLWAGRWEGDVASASALRWASAAVLLSLSALIWARRPLAGWADRLGWRIEPGAGGLVGMATGSAIILALLPLLAMGAYVGVAALHDRPLEAETGELLTWAGLLSVVLIAVGCALPSVTLPDRTERGRGRPAWAQTVGGLMLTLAALPLVAVTAYVVGSALRGNPLVGPEPGTFFARLGLAGSYVPPMLVLAGTLVGYALRERSPGFALAASLALNLAATVGYLLAGARGGGAFDLTLATRLALLNAIVGSASALAWVGAVAAWRRRGREAGSAGDDGRLTVLVALNVALVLLVLTGGTAAVFLDPAPAAVHFAIAGPWGWAAVLLALGSAAAWARSSGRPLAADWLGIGLLALADFLALGMAFRDSGSWLVYHGILAGQAMAAVGLVLLAWQRSGFRPGSLPDESRAALVRWETVALAVVALFAMGSHRADPQSPWWTVGGLAVAAGLAATLAAWSGQPGFLPLGAVLVNLAATLGWLDTARGPALADLLHVNVVALTLPAPLWLWLDRRMDRPIHTGSIPFVRVGAWAALAVVGLGVGTGLADDAAAVVARSDGLLGWLALGAAIIAMAAGLWDWRARGAVAGLYLLGLCACGWAVHQFHLPTRWLILTGTMLLSAYSVGASYLWSRRAGLRGLADRLGIPRPDAEDQLAGLAWLVPANLALATLVLGLACSAILSDPDATLRASAANAVLAQGLAIGLLARGERRVRLQFATLGVGVLGAVALGWAGVAPGSPTAALDRLAAVLVALVATAALYGIGLAKILPDASEWSRAARRLFPGLLVLGGFALAVVLGAELNASASGRAVSMSPPAIAAVALAFAGAGAAALVAALVPGRDPLGLSERGRTVYVYASEALLAALIAHLRLTMPWLFGDIFVRYGPLIVMGVAFLGVGLGELFRRQQRRVLAEPLERTGIFLPLLPLLGALWTSHWTDQDVVFLVLLGGLYTTLSLMRSSTGFGALATLAFNGALWAVLGRWRGYGLAEHPQLWVIPPALCVLAGLHLNRDRLSEAQAASIRYAAALAIYLASTADIVLTGVARAPWLPLVLGALAIVGIFAGLLLRVRGFLFLGVGFLALAIFAIIWYAAVDLQQTWIWSASGIVAGALILAIFGLFEKKRTEVLRVVDQIKGWEP